MARVVAPDGFPSILSGTKALKRLEQFANVTVYVEKASSQEDLIQRLKGAEVAINIRASEKARGVIDWRAFMKMKPSCIRKIFNLKAIVARRPPSTDY